ncbi:reduced folate transporter [Tenrec ecaudatus]|uniref:reduced folate transporter n=1 Tax=Tenrec ecaudatus TaxID=94439 RepID=UPI003F59CDBF
MVPSGPAATEKAEKQPALDPTEAWELKSWRVLVVSLCLYGFMAQIRPGESFVTPYLLRDKNFTLQEVTNKILPVLSYSYLAVLVPVFLLTDYLRYKPVLVLQGVSYVSLWLLLLLGHTVLHMQFMEFFYSITMAARIAYSSYIFSLVRPERYQRMAGYSRCAVLLGVFTSSVLGQLLVSVGSLSFTTLNYITLGFLTFSLLLTLFLKRPKRSLFFNRSTPSDHAALPSELDRMALGGPSKPASGKPRPALLAAWRDSVLVRMCRELGTRLQQPQLRLWSLWWIFNSAGYYLVTFYVHVLWNRVQGTQSSSMVYNGAADAASTLLGAITSFAAGFVKIRWALWSKLVIATVTAIQAGLIFLMIRTNNIWVCYTTFVLFRGAYQFLVPIATFLIASSLSKELCALAFGINTFLATSLKTLITVIVSDTRVLSLPVHSQFQVYFGYFVVLSVLYFAGALLVDLWHHLCQGRHQPVAQELTSPAQKATQVPGVQDKGLGSLSLTAPPLPPEDSAQAPWPTAHKQSLLPKET